MKPMEVSDGHRVASGIRGLDTILGGGFFVGSLYIVQGSPGAGKTILTNELCFNHVAAGGRAIFVTLLAENHARMLANLRRLAFFDESMIPDRLVYLSAFVALRDGGLTALLQLLRREIRQRAATVLVIDGLVSAHTSAASDDAFKQFVHDLQEVALGTACTLFLTTNDTREVAPERTMVDGLISLNDRLYGWQAASDLQVLKFRGGPFLRGRHSYQIDDTGITVWPRIEALYAYPSTADQATERTITTGVPALDDVFSGGLPAESTTMVIGPSGIGKTTIGLQYLSEASTAEPGLLFGFYETPTRLRIKADRIGSKLGALFEQGVVEHIWQTPTSDLLDAYGYRLLDAVRRRGVKRLFIDGLTAFQNGVIDPARVGDFFSALANELRVMGVTTIYSLEVPDVLGSTMRMPIQNTSSLAENIVLLRYAEQDGALTRLLSVLKVRDSGFDARTFKFSITRHGIDLVANASRTDQTHRPPATENAGRDHADRTRKDER